MRRLAPVFALLFLAPLVAEYILGDMPVILLPAIVAFAPMYGGGALLIREVARRTGRGWPTMLLLGLAYGVFEEGMLTQSLFNPGYLDLHLLDHGFIPALGIAAPWTIYVVMIHPIWSIAAPIVLVEEATGARRTQPWLGRKGLAVVSALFVLGCAIFFFISYGMGKHFLASPAQLTSTVVIVAALVALAFALPNTGARVGAHEGTHTGTAPRPLAVAAVAAVAAGVFMCSVYLPTAIDVPLALTALVVMGVLVARWSARSGWGHWHRFALGAAAVFTYAWHSFLMGLDAKGAEMVLNEVSHVVFSLATVYIIWTVYRRIRRHEADPATVPGVEALPGEPAIAR